LDGSAAGPSEILAAVNTALPQEQTIGPLRFVTACCLVIEPHASGVNARLAVAGHPLPMLRGPDAEIGEVGTSGRPLSIAADVRYPEVQVQLSPGSTVVLYTDGVTEARNDSGTEFDEDGLRRVLATSRCGTAAETVTAVTAAVEGHLRGSRYGVDDLAVLALRC
jgi:serine phosphatase RsbU (regulator of sigma subunit)